MASKNISFDSIPASIRKPGRYMEFNTSLAVRTLPANAQSVLIIGQRLASGSVASLVPTQVFSDKEAAAYFGTGSIAHRMVQAAINAYPYLNLNVVGVDDASSSPVKRVETMTITGPATASGSIVLWIGNDRIEVGIASADTATVVAQDIAAELAAHPDIPFAVTQATGVLTFTAKNAGTVANQIDFAADVKAAGITAAFAQTTAGSVDPDISAALAEVYSGSYTIYATPFNDATSLATLKTHLNSIAGPLEQRPATAYFGYDGALASATTLATGINSGRMLCAYLRGTKSPAYEIAAAFAAVKAYEEDPARPLNTLELTGVAAPVIDQRLSRTEQESCLANGVTPLEVNASGNVAIVRAISTYTKNSTGVSDVSLLDITTICTLDYARKAWIERIALRFPRSKLSSKTPAAVRDELIDVAEKLEELEILENVAANLDGFIVERDSQDNNRLDAKLPTDVVNGLHVFAGRIDLLL